MSERGSQVPSLSLHLECGPTLGQVVQNAINDVIRKDVARRDSLQPL